MLANTFPFPFLVAGILLPVCFSDDTVLVRILQSCDDILKYKCTVVCERVSWALISFGKKKDYVTVLL